VTCQVPAKGRWLQKDLLHHSPGLSVPLHPQGNVDPISHQWRSPDRLAAHTALTRVLCNVLFECFVRYVAKPREASQRKSPSAAVWGASSFPLPLFDSRIKFDFFRAFSPVYPAFFTLKYTPSGASSNALFFASLGAVSLGAGLGGGFFECGTGSGFFLLCATTVVSP
jgi:hypothetical protein